MQALRKMNLARVFWRSLHQTYRALERDESSKSKSARQVIKLIGSSDRPNIRDDIQEKSKPGWQKQELALRRKFKGERWNPSKRLSREEMESVRLLKSQFPVLNASNLAERYKVSPEAIRRVLKSKWQPTEQESVRLHERWKRRGDRIKEMFEQNPDMSASSQTIMVPKKISISSARTSTDFVLRNARSTKLDRDIPKNKKRNMKERSKLFLLKESAKER